MKLKRVHVVTILCISALLAVFAFLYFRVTIPFDTAEQFVQLIYQHRIDDAKQMMDPADLDNLPPEYWSRIAQTEFPDDLGLSFSCTPESLLLHNTIVFWVNVPDEAGGVRDSSVQYYSTGRTITVHQTDFSLTPR